jgi:3-deoxy-manno-octulosonate cytidylyltransferase (CMP-KDO synthetase)
VAVPPEGNVVVAILPARMGSVRLVGKMLADLGGVPLIVRTWQRARAAVGVDRVVVATDDDAIAAACTAAGAEVVRTGECASGTDRVAAAAVALDLRADDVVVNVQGDEPFVDPAHVAAIAAAVGPESPIATGAVPLADDPSDPARVKVVCDDHGRALYFSRQPIPSGGPFRLHLGVYAFRADALSAVAALPVAALESSERLEQLRWLAAGWPIRVVPLIGEPLSVDTFEDLARARARLSASPSPGASA